MIKKIVKNILDSNAYKVVIKPTLNISTAGYYDIVDQLANSIITDRKTEFLNFLNDNYDLFQDEDIIKNEHFISGLMTLYQEIIKQRFEWKRARMYGIFLGFVNNKDKEAFELERIFYTINLMTSEDYVNLVEWMDVELDEITNNTGYFANLIGLGLVCNYVKYVSSELQLGRFYEESPLHEYYDLVKDLENNLNDSVGREIKIEYKLSDFGVQLIQVLNQF